MQSKTAPTRRRASLPTADQRKSPRLLYVEDNAETRILLEHLLGGTCDITAVPGVEEALSAIGSDKTFDLFLLDINLGRGPSGTELLRRIRDQLGEVPAIALTTRAAPGDRKDLLDKGFDAYVAKPFVREDLTEAIEEVLSDTHARGARPTGSPSAYCESR